MPRKENAKAITWERDRRNRMNGYFKALADLLPPQQEGRKRNKVDILIQASKYIQELQSRTEEIFRHHESESQTDEELARLKQLVAQLLSRTELLSDLLKNAGVSIPEEPAFDKISPLKWSNKINLCDIDNINASKKSICLVKRKERKTEKNKSAIFKRQKKKIVVSKVPSSSDTSKILLKDSKNEDQENKARSNNKEKRRDQTNQNIFLKTKSIDQCRKSKQRCLQRLKKVVKSKKSNIGLKNSCNSKSTNSLMLSDGKLIPISNSLSLVSPNISMNSSSCISATPFILNNTPGQMIVVQPIQANSLISSVKNDKVVGTLQKMIVNKIPSLDASVLLNRDWMSNLQTIVSSSKIGGHKGILPKIKEVTETSIAYKIPIPPVPRKLDTKQEACNGLNKVSLAKNVKESPLSINEVLEDKISGKSLKRNIQEDANNLVEVKRKKTKLINIQEEEKMEEIDNIRCKSLDNLKQVLEKFEESTPKEQEEEHMKVTTSKKENFKNTEKKGSAEHENSKIKFKDQTSLITEKLLTDNTLSASENKTNLDAISKTSENVNLLENGLLHEKENITNVLKENPSKIPIEISKKHVDHSSGSSNDNCQDEDVNTSTIENSLSDSNKDGEDQLTENNKILLNLDTNTTTTLKDESQCSVLKLKNCSEVQVLVNEEISNLRNSEKENDCIIKSISYSPSNSFIPINKSDSLHSELTNDIFASLQVPSSSNNLESISPTAAFLMSFPLVSSLSGKAEVLDEDIKDDFKYNSQTPPMLLQIGNIESNNFKLGSAINSEAETSAMNGISHSKFPIDLPNSTSRLQAKQFPRVISSQMLTDPYKLQSLSLESKASVNDCLQKNQSLVVKKQPTFTDTNTSIENSKLKNSEKTQSSQMNINTINICNNSKNTSLKSTSDSLSNDPSVKYASTIPVTSNSIVSTLVSKYNSHSDAINQDSFAESQSRNYEKDNISSNNMGNQYSFTYENAKLQINKSQSKESECYTESFNNRNNSFSNMSCGNINISQNREKEDNLHLQQSQPVNSNSNYNSIKKTENNKMHISMSSENNFDYHKKIHDIVSNPYDSEKKTQSNTSHYSIEYPSSKESNSFTNSIQKPHLESDDFIQQSKIMNTSLSQETSSVKTAITTAQNSSNFNLLSWSNMSSVSNNNLTFTQYETVLNENLSQSKNMNENLLYLRTTKELPLSSRQNQFNISELQSPFEKSKVKPNAEVHKRSYGNSQSKGKTIRSSQNQPAQKLIRQQNLKDASLNSEFKYPEDNSSKLRFSMNIEHGQQNYSNESIISINQHLQQQQHSQGQVNESLNLKHQPGPPSENQKYEKSNSIFSDFTLTSQIEPAPNVVQSKSCNGNHYGDSNIKNNNKLHNNQPKYQTVHTETTSYNNNSKDVHNSVVSNKSKRDACSYMQNQDPLPQQALRPPLNWMMTPDIKHNTNIGDIILPPIGKELEFCQNNLFSQTSSYNQAGSNHQFYNNYDMSAHAYPSIPTFQNESKRNIDSNFYSEDQTLHWSPSKSVASSNDQTQKNMDSSLPSDLLLNSNTIDKSNHIFNQMSVRSNSEEMNKGAFKQHGITNSQNSQPPSHNMPFLSVSQLVDHGKVEKIQQQNSSNSNNNVHNHQAHNYNIQQQQTRKQRKNNGSPRTNTKRQLDARKQQNNNNSSESVSHEESDKMPSSNINLHANFQQQYKYQNDIQWRNRNCKNNYTAEALIGPISTGNCIPDKNLSKYSSNYTQNKFSTPLSGDPMAINYFPNIDDQVSGYGQMNQNFNHSYSYSSNPNIYPPTNFMPNISNSSANYMMPLHESTEYVDTNNFLLSTNVTPASVTAPILPLNSSSSSTNKNQQSVSTTKHQNYDKRLHLGQARKSKRKQENVIQNFDFSLSVAAQTDNSHHSSTFLPASRGIYQNHSQSNAYSKTGNGVAPIQGNHFSNPSTITGVASNQGITSNSAIAAAHQPPGTSLTNFNLSAIFPEIDDKMS